MLYNNVDNNNDDDKRVVFFLWVQQKQKYKQTNKHIMNFVYIIYIFNIMLL